MKVRMSKLLVIISISASAVMLLNSCATDNTPKPPHEQRRLSTIPQNRPESWEGGSPFGGFGQSR
jgi:hypothetical protein